MSSEANKNHIAGLHENSLKNVCISSFNLSTQVLAVALKV